jgi:hypothetical protein
VVSNNDRSQKDLLQEIDRLKALNCDTIAQEALIDDRYRNLLENAPFPVIIT